MTEDQEDTASDLREATRIFNEAPCAQRLPLRSNIRIPKHVDTEVPWR